MIKIQQIYDVEKMYNIFKHVLFTRNMDQIK